MSDQEFSQIALLEPEIVNHCQKPEQARALLGLVLRYVAPKDPSWRQIRVVRARRSGEHIDLRVHGALWLADLKSKHWIPFQGEKVRANRGTLRELLEPNWLTDNNAAVSLLCEKFEFDELELQLLAVDPQCGNEVRDKLAKLVKAVGAELSDYDVLTQALQEVRKRGEVARQCRNLGFAVQEAVKEALESRGLEVKLVDRGFDYEVRIPASLTLDEAYLARFEVGPYLLEVKATTQGEVKLTPTQATMASNEAERYVLCVVDLRSVPETRLSDQWHASDVEALAKVITDIGAQARETVLLIGEAKSNRVGIRNETVLRYGVPAQVWSPGCSISEWVDQIFERLRGTVY